jgi:hypothetical protein
MIDYLKKEKVLDNSVKLSKIHKKPRIKAKDYLKFMGFDVKRASKIIKHGAFFEGLKRIDSPNTEVETRKVKIKLGY